MTSASMIRRSIKHLLMQNESKVSQYFRSHARPLGSGTYNDTFVITVFDELDHRHEIVMRVSYYDIKVLNEVLSKVDGSVSILKGSNHATGGRRHLIAQDALEDALYQSRMDPVKVKNYYSMLCKLLIESQTCPYYVHMFHYQDYKDFLNLIKHLIPEKRMLSPQQMFTNISFHELYHGNLLQLLKQQRLSSMQLKAVVFQILFAILCLQHYLPGFRHNDVSLSNILIKFASATEDNKNGHVYKIYGTTYLVPFVGVCAALWDFDLAHAPGRIVTLGKVNASSFNGGHGLSMRNHVIVNNRFALYTKDKSVQNINNTFNPSFDTYFFFSELQRALKSLSGAYLDVATFLGSFDALRQPKEAYTSEVHPELVPINIINHVFFNEFKSQNAKIENTEIHAIKALPLQFVICSTSQDIELLHNQVSERRTVNVNPDVCPAWVVPSGIWQPPSQVTVYNFGQDV